MNVTILGAGNCGLAMAAHLSLNNNNVTLWNRSASSIKKILGTKQIVCEGAINAIADIELITDNMEIALKNADIIFVTTPANAHKEIAKSIGTLITKDCLIVLCPGRTFGALEFESVFRQYNKVHNPKIVETQTIIYTCRKITDDHIHIMALKNGVLISTFNPNENENLIFNMPDCLHQYFRPAKSMVETSIGNVGMILHCAPLLLNSGWTESKENSYKFYWEGITPSISAFLEKLDEERVAVSKLLGYEVESTKNWIKRTYKVSGDNLYECIQSNLAYRSIYAPNTLNHRYIYEDVPCGLVPIEAIGKKLGLKMKCIGLIIDLASGIMNIDFRDIGRGLHNLNKSDILKFLGFEGEDYEN